MYLLLVLLDTNEAALLDKLDELSGLVFFVVTPADEVMVVAFLLLVLPVLAKDPPEAVALAVATVLRILVLLLR